MDIGARRLGLDPAEIRRRNLVRPAEMPYRPGLTYKDGVAIAYDPGDFPAAFERALGLLGYDDWRRRQAAQPKDGTRRIGVASPAMPRAPGSAPSRDPPSGRSLREGLRADRRRRPGPGPRDHARPDLRAGAGRGVRGRHRAGGRHDALPLRHGHRRQPGDGQCRARRRQHRARGARAGRPRRGRAARVRARRRADRGEPRLRHRHARPHRAARPPRPGRGALTQPEGHRRAGAARLHLPLSRHRHLGLRHAGCRGGGRSRDRRGAPARLRGGPRSRPRHQSDDRGGAAAGRGGPGASARG